MKGIELEAKICDHLGWTSVQLGGVMAHYDSSGKMHGSKPRYARDMNAAWALFDYVRSKDPRWTPDVYLNDMDGLAEPVWVARLTRYAERSEDFRVVDAVATTAPKAIALCFLSWTGEPVTPAAQPARPVPAASDAARGIRVFARTAGGPEFEIADLFWFEENGVRDWGGLGDTGDYAFRVETAEVRRLREEVERRAVDGAAMFQLRQNYDLLAREAEDLRAAVQQHRTSEEQAALALQNAELRARVAALESAMQDIQATARYACESKANP